MESSYYALDKMKKEMTIYKEKDTTTFANLIYRTGVSLLGRF
ncbi:hypothetical protein [Caldicellulosiruptor morganii]|uniref:Uncharacterized protein n=1 Tax=Caldicellulosiruptor morganii TaxID=1387555 RepID=A0ABY7BPP6_9FIRM|nr:hypothetical protein [Caldicellulosiruptor morganii]WAM34031.1 hypothetical protein OTK00_000179 [Caldicellulosiruptor morganii]